MLGLLLGISQLGTICGPLVGGAFTTGYTWRWCRCLLPRREGLYTNGDNLGFYINLPLGVLIGVPLFLMRIPEQISKPRPMSVLPKLHEHLELLGFAILAPAIIMLLLALQFGGNEYAWSSSQVIGLFCGFGATLIVWVLRNYRGGDDALLPMAIIKRRAVWMSGLNFALMTATVFGSSYYLPIYYQAVKGVSAVLSGVYLLAIILPQLIAAVVSGSLGKFPAIIYLATTNVLTGHSHKNWPRATFCYRWSHSSCDWQWTILLVSVKHFNRRVDRILHHHWRWERHGSSDGTLFPDLLPRFRRILP